MFNRLKLFSLVVLIAICFGTPAAAQISRITLEARDGWQLKDSAHMRYEVPGKTTISITLYGEDYAGTSVDELARSAVSAGVLKQTHTKLWGKPAVEVEWVGGNRSGGVGSWMGIDWFVIPKNGRGVRIRCGQTTDMKTPAERDEWLNEGSARCRQAVAGNLHINDGAVLAAAIPAATKPTPAATKPTPVAPPAAAVSASLPAATKPAPVAPPAAAVSAPLPAQTTEPEPKFGPFRVGASVSTLPFPCSAEEEVCDGPYGALWVRVWNRKGVISQVDVLYYGSKLNRTSFEAPDGDITLAQAIKIHSLAADCKRPKFAKQGNQIVDFVNHRSYLATAANADSRALQVTYYSPSDPSFAAAPQNEDFLASTTLLRAAILTLPYAETPEHKVFAQRVDERVAKIKETGEIVLAALRIAQDSKDRTGSFSAESVEEANHVYGLFQQAQAALIDLMKVNKDVVDRSDRAKIPKAFIKEVDAKYAKFVDDQVGL